MSAYQDFLATKAVTAQPRGPSGAVGASEALYPFQQAIVAWAARKGRAAVFADTGLGKTRMQLEWARMMGCPTLILAPLAVAQQTIKEGRAIGIDVVYARAQADAGPITITNYEMLKAFDPKQFGAVVLDESSILKSFDGKTRTALIETFAETPYRLCCTATPAPNDLEEYGNHAEFLGIGTRRDMLATYFVHRDTGWSVKGHAVEPFYRWLASWAVMVKMPSDIGFSDEGYVLPPLEVRPQWVAADTQEVAHANGMLFLHGLDGIQGRATARKSTVAQKVERAAAIIRDNPGQWLVWAGLNSEADALTVAVEGAVNVEGSQTPEAKAAALGQFAAGQIQTLVTKIKIGGFGLNLQNCHQVMFLGLNDSYEQFYQAVRRCWRFGQKYPVDVHVILSEMESPILENVLKKEQQAQEVSRQMVKRMAEYEREELGVEIASREANIAGPYPVYGDGWEMRLGDCVDQLQKIAPASVDFSVFSPPFLNLYSYTASDRDMGNNKTDGDFFKHFAFFLEGMYRVMKQGRVVACHVAQVPTTLVDDGVIGLQDFRGDTIRAFVSAGFVHHGEVCIDKDPQAQAIRTHSKALLFAQLRKDSSWSRPAIADYILLFRKPGENAVPIHPDITNNQWIEWARPIWYGIRESDTLNVAEARTEKDEKHIAPLQLATIERCISLWSNKGETVLSPFAGIGSEGYQAVKLGRKFTGIELKPEYFAVACRNLNRATQQRKQGSLTLALETP